LTGRAAQIDIHLGAGKSKLEGGEAGGRASATEEDEAVAGGREAGDGAGGGGSISLGTSSSTRAVSLSASSGAVSLGTSGSTVSLGTGGSTVSLGTGGLRASLSTSSRAISLSASGSTVSLSTSSRAIGLGAGGLRAVSLSSGGLRTVSLGTGRLGAIGLGTSGSTGVVSLSSGRGTSVVGLGAGRGAGIVSLSTSGSTSVISLGASGRRPISLSTGWSAVSLGGVDRGVASVGSAVGTDSNVGNSQGNGVGTAALDELELRGVSAGLGVATLEGLVVAAVESQGLVVNGRAIDTDIKGTAGVIVTLGERIEECDKDVEENPDEISDVDSKGKAATNTERCKAEGRRDQLTALG
jgi:hypothetical protein